jgi:hypothetical protein
MISPKSSSAPEHIQIQINNLNGSAMLRASSDIGHGLNNAPIFQPLISAHQR